MPSEPQKTNEQQKPDETDLQAIRRAQVEIQATLAKITEHLGITKKPSRPLAPGDISGGDHDPEGLEPAERLED